MASMIHFVVYLP